MDFPDFYVKGPTPCSRLNPDDFFPEAEDPDSLRRAKEAKKVCGSCVYQVECLSWALETWEKGIWGGTSEYERREMRKRLASRARYSAVSRNRT